jgi:hypothetical protein
MFESTKSSEGRRAQLEHAYVGLRSMVNTIQPTGSVFNGEFHACSRILRCFGDIAFCKYL